jgi:glucosylglycerate synthase
VAEHNLMTDDLLRQIIGVGRVDLLVGVPRPEGPDAAAALVRVVRACFRSQFHRSRAALLYVDDQPTGDGRALVQRLWEEEAGARGGLRTTHLVTAAVPGLEHDGVAGRMMVTAADLLQAQAVVLLDPDVGDLTPERIATLAAPLADRVDLVAPAHPRAADEGLLVTQLLRPLTRAIYGADLREPLLPEFGASARLAAHCAQFEVDAAQARTHYWIAAEALAGPFTVRQAALGPRRSSAVRARGGLPALFLQVVSSVFASIGATSRVWLARAGEALPDVNVAGAATADQGSGGARVLQTFADDLSNLDEILRRILRPETHAALKDAGNEPGPALPDRLWAEVVAEFLLAHRHHVILRDHTVKALLPLYIGRTGTFLLNHGSGSAEAVEAAVEALCVAFEGVRPRIVERWVTQQRGK